jgi:hypothetical protein
MQKLHKVQFENAIRYRIFIHQVMVGHAVNYWGFQTSPFEIKKASKHAHAAKSSSFSHVF